jgi:hypothetical protein
MHLSVSGQVFQSFDLMANLNERVNPKLRHCHMSIARYRGAAAAAPNFILIDEPFQGRYLFGACLPHA